MVSTCFEDSWSLVFDRSWRTHRSNSHTRKIEKQNAESNSVYGCPPVPAPRLVGAKHTATIFHHGTSTRPLASQCDEPPTHANARLQLCQLRP